MSKMAKAQKKDVFTAGEIATEEDLPGRFLRRILKKLSKAKILHSYKGQDGGFSLAKPAREIRFSDIVRIFQGDIDITNCFLRGVSCPETKKCILRKKLKVISNLVNKELGKITLASLL
jgi:Rrf2 family protein|tara:strand:- start:46 stop:402 length:357 start_codon:yes stop_codon:yes gene_type:complete